MMDGYEYAIRRDTDLRWLDDPDMDGSTGQWTDDVDEATWAATPREAMAMATVNRLADPDMPGELAAGVHVWARPFDPADDDADVRPRLWDDTTE